MPRIFISYAHADNDTGLVDRFEKRLSALCQLAKPEAFELWRDSRFLLAGDRFQPKILDALNEADYGLLLLSANFMVSDFIRQHELPRFVAERGQAAEGLKRVVPVQLRQLPWNAIEDAGIRQHLVFNHKGKSFQDMSGTAQQDHFVNSLFEQMHTIHQQSVALS